MEDIEGISQLEFNYLLNNREELKLFLQNPANMKLISDEQFEKALELLQAL